MSGNRKIRQNRYIEGRSALQTSFHRGKRAPLLLKRACSCIVVPISKAIWERSIIINPNFARAHNNLGSILQGQGRLNEAIECYNKALKINPDFAGVHSNLGNALSGLGRHPRHQML